MFRRKRLLVLLALLVGIFLGVQAFLILPALPGPASHELSLIKVGMTLAEAEAVLGPAEYWTNPNNPQRVLGADWTIEEGLWVIVQLDSEGKIKGKFARDFRPRSQSFTAKLCSLVGL